MIGFVTVSHPDYQGGGHVAAFSEAARRALTQRGVSLFDAGLADEVRTAREAGSRLTREGVDGVVLFLGSWMECSTTMALLREVEHLPLCMWGFPMWREDGREMSTGSYVSLAMFQGVLERIQLPCKNVLGMPDSPAAGDVASFCRAATAYQALKRSRIGLIGYTSMSIYTGTFDHVLLRAKIGPEAVHIDAYSLIREAERAAPEAIDAAVSRVRSLARVAPDADGAPLRKAASLYVGLRSLCARMELDAVNAKCQYEFSKDYGMVLCVPLSLAAEDGLVTGCEGDMLCSVSMLMLSRLSGQVVAYGDAIHHEAGVLKLSPCGFMPYSLGAGEREVRAFMPGVGFCGIQNSFVMKPGRVTCLRLIEGAEGYRLLCFTGEGLDTNLRQGFMPALDVRLDGDADALMRRFSGQHYAIAYGDLTEPIRDLARALRVPLEIL